MARLYGRCECQAFVISNDRPRRLLMYSFPVGRKKTVTTPRNFCYYVRKFPLARDFSL